MNTSIKLIIVFLFIHVSFSACSNRQLSELDVKKDTYYFSAGFEDAGLSFYMQEPILSLEELHDRKNNFIKNNPNYDRYYYKVKSTKNKKMIYAYSLLTDELIETLLSDNKNRLVESKKVIDANTTIECKRTYIEKYPKLQSKEICTNGETFVYDYIFNKQNKIYTHTTTRYYKNKKLTYKNIYKDDGTLLIFNAHGRFQKKEEWIAKSDLIPIFKK